MDLPGLTEAISSEIQAQGAEANVDATKATATNPPEWWSGEQPKPGTEDWKAKAEPEGGNKDGDKAGKPANDGWDEDDKGKPLTDKELDDFKKVGKHFVSYPKYAKTQDRVRQLESEIAQLKSQKPTNQDGDEEARNAREELKKMGYIPQDELDEIQKQKEHIHFCLCSNFCWVHSC